METKEKSNATKRYFSPLFFAIRIITTSNNPSYLTFFVKQTLRGVPFTYVLDLLKEEVIS